MSESDSCSGCSCFGCAVMLFALAFIWWVLTGGWGKLMQFFDGVFL